MPFAVINGNRLHYEIRGEGPCLLFIRGLGADLKNPIHLFSCPLVKQFTILAYDARGLGESDSPEEPWSIADMADDAAGLAAAAGWDHYHVFGSSMGGMVAQELALRYPERVDRMVLAVTNAGGTPPVIDRMEKMSTLEMLRTGDTRQDEAWAAAHPDMVAMTEMRFKAMWEEQKANPALLRGYNHQVDASLAHDTMDRLTGIKAPTFVFAGRYDGGNPLEAAKAMADRIPNAAFTIVEWGHGNWFFDASLWLMISDFLLG